MTPDELIESRGRHYGDPRTNHERIAGMWSAYLGRPVSAHDVAMCMVMVKISRAKAGQHTDNYDDAEAYIKIARELR